MSKPNEKPAGQIAACITDQKSAWSVLNESMVLAREMCSELRLIICQSIIGNECSPEATRNFVEKLQHAARRSCDESGVKVSIETLDCGSREASRVKKIIAESSIELLVLTDSLPSNRLARLLTRKAENIARSCSCSVLLVR